MKIENISKGKIIGIGEMNVLPGETMTVPEAFERSPILEVYRHCGFAKIIEDGTPKKGTEEPKAKEPEITPEELETIRKARIASLSGISEEGLAKLANELGINMATCKDQADVLKKVKAALKK